MKEIILISMVCLLSAVTIHAKNTETVTQPTEDSVIFPQSNQRITRGQAEELAEYFPAEEQAIILLEKFAQWNLSKNHPSFQLNNKNLAIIHSEAEEYIHSLRHIPNSTKKAYADVFEEIIFQQDAQSFLQADNKNDHPLMKNLLNGELSVVVIYKIYMDWLIETYHVDMMRKILERRFNLSAH